MHKTIFKVLDDATGKYWNGNTVWPRWDDIGQKWTRKSTIERDLLVHLSNLLKTDPNAKLPNTWRIVEYELIEKIKKSNLMNEFMFSILLKTELHRINWKLTAFYNQMEARCVMDDIHYIIRLKPETGQRFVSLDKIIESRAKLRLLGIKTRTFREFGGMFGMMSSEQAMRARLVLDLEWFIDVDSLRDKVREELSACLPITSVLGAIPHL